MANQQTSIPLACGGVAATHHAHDPNHLIGRLPSAVFACGAENGRPLLYVSERMGHLTGRSPHELITNQRHLDEFVSKDDLRRVRDAIDDALDQGSEYQVSYRLLNESLKDARWVIESGTPDRTGAHHLIHGFMAPFHARATHADLIEHHSRYDSHTGLPNRLSLRERVQSRLAQLQRTGESFALHYFDIDRFDEINETHGQEFGDKLLKQIGARLLSLTGAADLIARIGGDEFAVVQDHIDSMHDAGHAAEKLFKSLGLPFDVGEKQVRVSFSGGVTMASSLDLNADELMKRASFALHHAKHDGRNRYRFYDDQVHEQVRRQILIAQAIPAAIADNEFFVEYQPQIDLKTGAISGLESLIRWQHPQHGRLSPAEFIQVAEKNGLIADLGEWVLRNACAKTLSFLDNQPPDVRLAVNVSAYQLTDHFFAGRVLGILDELKFPYERLEIEITESALINPTSASKGTIHQLASMGVRFAADDFGTGYSSLQYLKHLPISILKIDQEFTRGLPGRVDNAIVAANVALAHSLEMNVVAEGVETRDQHATLQQLSCDCGQGYLFGRPQPLADIISAEWPWNP